MSASTAPTASVTESAPTAPTAPPTIDDVVSAMLNAEGTLDALNVARIADGVAFTVSAITTHAALSTGTSASSIGAAAKVAGLRGTSASFVLRHGRTGEILTIAGALDDGISPRDIQTCYDKSTKLNGVRVNISVKPAQHNAVVAAASDLMDAYRRLVKANRDNLAALKTIADGETADETGDDETADETGETAEVNVSSVLAGILASLESVMGADLTDADMATVGTIYDALDMLSADGGTRAVAA
jgi:hypothetical protein